MMSQNHKMSLSRLALLFQQGVARVASGFFQSPALAGGQSRHINAAARAGYAEPGAEGLRPMGVRSGFGAQAVIQSQRREFKFQTGRENTQNTGQSRGIGSAGKRQQQPHATRQGQLAQAEALHRETHPGRGGREAAQIRQKIHV